MHPIIARILRWSAGGAAYAFVIAVGAQDATRLAITVSIGVITGAIAGAAASVAAPKLLQACLTGVMAGVCGSVLAYYLLGSAHGFWEQVGRYTLGAVVALLIVRYGLPTRDEGGVFAAQPKT